MKYNQCQSSMHFCAVGIPSNEKFCAKLQKDFKGVQFRFYELEKAIRK